MSPNPKADVRSLDESKLDKIKRTVEEVINELSNKGVYHW